MGNSDLGGGGGGGGGGGVDQFWGGRELGDLGGSFPETLVSAIHVAP